MNTLQNIKFTPEERENLSSSTESLKSSGSGIVLRNPFENLKLNLSFDNVKQSPEVIQQLKRPAGSTTPRSPMIRSEPSFLPSQRSEYQQYTDTQQSVTPLSPLSPQVTPPPSPIPMASVLQALPINRRKNNMLRASADSLKFNFKGSGNPISLNTSKEIDPEIAKLSNILNSKFGGSKEEAPSPIQTGEFTTQDLSWKLASLAPKQEQPSLHCPSPLRSEAVVDLTEKRDRYIGKFVTNVIGSRAFYGKIEARDVVDLVRDDSMVIMDEKPIAVINRAKQRIGELCETVTLWLSPLLDSKKIRLLSYLSKPPLDNSDYFVAVHVWVQRGAVFTEQDKPHLQQLAEYLGVAVNYIIPSSIADIPIVDLTSVMEDSSESKKRTLSSPGEYDLSNKRTKTVDDTTPDRPDSPELDQQIEHMFNNLTESTQLKELEPPKSLCVQLRPYQKQALAWMLNREKPIIKPPPVIPYPWEEHSTSDGKKYYHNKETNQAVWKLPLQYITPIIVDSEPSVRGGILADEMGMGKTVEVLSLLLTERYVPATVEPQSAAVDTESADEVFVPSKSTLIVCPLSVLHQWFKEIQSKIDPAEEITVYCYHGNNRNRDPAFLASHDIVLTTFATLACEIPPDSSKNLKRTVKVEDSALMKVNWFRVVLDEAHTIKDRNTRTAKAAFALKAERRWCVTGTPIQNKLDDIFSLLHFLHVEPYGEYTWWSKVIARPMKNKDDKAITRLQGILHGIMLRRTKDQKVGNGTPIVSLPPRTVKLHPVTLSEEEDKLYQTLWSSSKDQVTNFIESGTLMENYAHVLELLLRLRQACDHPLLIKKKTLNDAQKLQGTLSWIAQLAPHEDLSRLKEILSTDLSDEECAICLETMDNPVATICGHVFCRACIEAHLSIMQENNSCPICRRTTPMHLLVPLPNSSFGPDPVEIKWKTSSKIEALLRSLSSINDVSVKSIVFSQWTSMLDLVEPALTSAGMRYVRLDGSMNYQQREKSINAFKDDPTIRVSTKKK